jgi:hypothetical protein
VNDLSRVLVANQTHRRMIDPITFAKRVDAVSESSAPTFPPLQCPRRTTPLLTLKRAWVREFRNEQTLCRNGKGVP